jgi:hypothetical protein
MGKLHLDLFSAATSSLVFRRRGENPGNVAGIFVQTARNLARDHIRAATRLEFTNVTILLARAIEACAFGGDAGAWGSVGAPELDQLIASRARISVSFGIESEVGARKRAVHPCGLIEDGNVRRDLFLFDELDSRPNRTDNHPAIGVDQIIGDRCCSRTASALDMKGSSFGIANSPRDWHRPG